MATIEEIKHLAKLARISISSEDLGKLTQEFDSVLAYIGQLDALDLPYEASPDIPPLRNVFRDDEHPTDSGINTKKLIAAFPKHSDNALVVKKIITHE